MKTFMYMYENNTLHWKFLNLTFNRKKKISTKKLTFTLYKESNGVSLFVTVSDLRYNHLNDVAEDMDSPDYF